MTWNEAHHSGGEGAEVTTNSLKAREFAIVAHGDQRYGADPYVSHLDDVAVVLADAGHRNDEGLMVAAYLHDVLEDTDCGPEELLSQFGIAVYQLVWGVTDEPGKNRAERHAKTYPKIAQDPRRVTLKLADRIANVKHSLHRGGKLMDMYRKEHPEFRAALYRESDLYNKALWEKLDTLFKAADRGGAMTARRRK